MHNLQTRNYRKSYANENAEEKCPKDEDLVTRYRMGKVIQIASPDGAYRIHPFFCLCGLSHYFEAIRLAKSPPLASLITSKIVSNSSHSIVPFPSVSAKRTKFVMVLF